MTAQSNLATSHRVLPNFIIAGVPKSGTTSLYTYFQKHPQFLACKVKEPRFLRPYDFDESKIDLNEYAKLFDQSVHKPITFEATAAYIFGGQPLASYVRRTFPEMKVLITLREPVARCFSFFREMKKQLEVPLEMTFTGYIDACFAAIERSEENSRLRWRGLFGSRYAEHLEGWLHELGPDRLRVGFFEHFVKDPLAFGDDICIWLGVDPISAHNIEATRERQSHAPRNVALHTLAEFTVRRFEAVLRRNPDIKTKIKNFYWRLNKNEKIIDTITPEDRARLDAYFEPHNQALAAMFRQYRPALALPPWLEGRASGSDAATVSETSVNNGPTP